MSLVCMVCLLAGCVADDGSTASGSQYWSRGVVLGSTEADTVALAALEDTTFAAWIEESGQLRLAQLDAALELIDLTDLDLAAFSVYAADLRLEAEASERLHLTWEDTVDGVPTVVYARLAAGRAEPLFRQEIQLPADAHHIDSMMRLEANRMEIFWSAFSSRNSGIYHRAVSLTGGEAAPAARLTETGRQPGVGLEASGKLRVAWVDEGRGSGYVSVWTACLDLESQTLEAPVSIAEVERKRGTVFQGPAVGGSATETIVTWSTGKRGVLTSLMSVPGAGGPEVGSGTEYPFGSSSPVTSASSSRGDRAQYVMISSAAAENVSPAHLLIAGDVVGAWGAPRVQAVQDQMLIFFTGLLMQRSQARSQVIVAPFDGRERGEPIPVTATRRPSLFPDLTVGAGGVVRAAWLESMGGGVYQVMAASTAPPALEALGDFRLTDLWEEAIGLGFDFLSLLFYAPMVISWVVLPLALVLVIAFGSRGDLRGWQVLAWLAAAVLLQLVCKRFVAPWLLPLHGPIQIGLSLAPVLLGGVLVWFYWRRSEEPSLLVSYFLFASVDTLYSLFVLIPQTFWAA